MTVPASLLQNVFAERDKHPQWHKNRTKANKQYTPEPETKGPIQKVGTIAKKRKVREDDGATAPMTMIRKFETT